MNNFFFKTTCGSWILAIHEVQQKDFAYSKSMFFLYFCDKSKIVGPIVLDWGHISYWIEALNEKKDTLIKFEWKDSDYVLFCMIYDEYELHLYVNNGKNLVHLSVHEETLKDWLVELEECSV